MTNFNIVVKVDPSGAVKGSQRVKRELNSVGDSANRVRNLIQGAFAFAGLGLGLQQLTQLADTYTNIQNRLKTVTSGS